METPSLLENDASKIPALHLLVQMGYIPLTPAQALAERGGRSSAVLLEDILRKQLNELNRITYRGKDHLFSETNLSAAILALRDLPIQDGYTSANKAFYDLVTLGKSFEQAIDGDRKSYSLKYVDWEHPENNVYHVVPEFSVLRTERTDTYRPDLVLFVNGIPMGVIECKSPRVKDSMTKAIRQHADYQHSSGIRSLYQYSNILLALAGNEARYATTDTQEKFWAAWREQTPTDIRQADEARLFQLVNSSLKPEHQATVLATMNVASQQFYHDLRSEPVSLTEQDRLLYSLCRPERLLDLMLNYILFDDSVKKIARYQQYFTVRQTLQRVSQIDPATGQRAGGVIWHTQGSGKSLTMVMLAQLLAKHPDIPNPKILLVTDRVDLDDQLTETFQKCKRDVIQATTGASEKIRKKLSGDEPDELAEAVELKKGQKTARDTSLLALLHEKSDDIVTTVINKFDKALKSSVEPITSPNLFILVDEAHRTQYGDLHISMRRLFPKACFLGFTGTPLMKTEKNTARQFGGLIEPAYTIGDAVKDGAVVPLLYEGRHHIIEVNASALNRSFDYVAEPLDEYGKATLKNKFSRLDILNEADQIIEARARDIVDHFTANIQGTGMKGQIVVGKKWQAVKYKKYIEQIGDLNGDKRVNCEVVISPPDVRESDDDDSDGYDGEVRSFWKQQMDRHRTPEQYEKTIINAFKKHDVPELIIVVRKLTTGFDAPRNTVLYLTSSLKEHELLQTIARVNRVYPGKDYGLIVDYHGNLGNLDQALNLYTKAGLDKFDAEDLKDALNSIDSETAKLPQAHAELWAIFQNVKNKRDQQAYAELLYDEEKWALFKEKLLAYAQLLKLSLSSISFMTNTSADQVDEYKKDVAFFLDLRQLVKWQYSDNTDYAAYELQIRKLIDKYISTEGETLIVTPQFALFDTDQRQTEMAKLAGQAAQADHIASKTLKAIEVRINDDPAFYRKLAELIQETIDAYHNQRISEGDYLRKAKEFEETFGRGQLEGAPATLQQNPVAMAFYGVVKTLLDKMNAQQSEEFFIELALGIDQHIREAILENGRPIVDWQNNLDLIGKIQIDLDDFITDHPRNQSTKLPWDLLNQLIEGCLSIAKLRYV